jgi:hypothetical protein
MTATPGSLWDKVDVVVLRDGEPETPSKDPKPDKEASARQLRRHLRILDVMGVVFWLYVLLKLFVFDVDRELVEAVFPNSDGLTNYRILFFLAVLVLVVVLTKRKWIAILYIGYVLFYPLVVLLWKLPRLIYKTKSWLVALAAVNVITAVFRDFKFNIITKSLALVALLLILASDNALVLVPASLALVLLLLVTLYRSIKASLSGSRFLDLQKSALKRFGESDFVEQFVHVPESLRDAELEKFDKDQMTEFVGKLGNGLLAVRVTYFWAYQLERYRQSQAPSFFTFLTYVWLFLISVITVWALNLSVLKIDPGQFDFATYPSNLQVLYYSFVSFALNGIPALEPVGDTAIVIKLVAGLMGLLLFGALVTNLLLVARKRHDDELATTVEAFKGQARSLESEFDQEFEIAPEAALDWLREIGSGIVGLLGFFSSRIPADFFDPEKGKPGTGGTGTGQPQ